MQELWPQAQICFLSRSEIKHARSLHLVLGDGREITILLDQGFGGWRSQAAPRHDFQARAAAQAKQIRSSSYIVFAESGETPIIIWEGSDSVTHTGSN